MELLLFVREQLLEGGHWRLPVVYFAEACKASQVGKMASVAKRHSCTVTPDYADCTHVIMP